MNQMEDAIRRLSIPPGFTSRTAFLLKRSTCGEDTENPAPSSLKNCSLEEFIVEANLQFKHRAWIVHDHLDHHEKEPDDTPNYENAAIPLEGCLPKGLFWGCSSCRDCLKVSAQWDPEAAHSIELEEAPVFQPTDEEFNDTLKYIESIYQKVKPYGFCRIVPPSSWQPPCFSDQNAAREGLNFSTQVQRITDFGSCTKRKRLAFGNVQESKGRKISKNNYVNGDTVNIEVNGSKQAKKVQFGPHFTYESFKKNADYFNERYFQKKSEAVISEAIQTTCHEQWEPSEKDIEGEYWRILEKPTEEIEVLCSANVDAESLRKRALQSLEAETSTSGWNLTNLSRLPGSLLSFENSDDLGDLAPKFRIGMCFSTLQWELAEQHLYSLCCLYLGAPKIWYGVPGHYFNKFQAAVEKHLPGNFAQNPELLHKPNLQFSPSTLKAEGIPVYRCVQRPREFILFVPGAYHTGFDCGFNVCESVCFATLDWLPHVQSVSALNREKHMKQLICHEKLLFKVAQTAIKARRDNLLRGLKTPEVMRWKEACGQGSAVAVTLKACAKEVARQREFLCTKSQSKRMDKSFDEGTRKECSTCNSILYLSAAFCLCNTSKYSCLKHAKNLCSCDWSEKVFLFRFDEVQLNLLVEATEGKFSAIHKWVKQHMQDEAGNTEPSQIVDLPDDSSSSEKALETSISSPDWGVIFDQGRVEWTEKMSHILGVLADSFDADFSDSSSKSDDVPVVLKEGKKPLAESHSASNGREPKSPEVVCLSSDDD